MGNLLQGGVWQWEELLTEPIGFSSLHLLKAIFRTGSLISFGVEKKTDEKGVFLYVHGECGLS